MDETKILEVNHFKTKIIIVLLSILIPILLNSKTLGKISMIIFFYMMGNEIINLYKELKKTKNY